VDRFSSSRRDFLQRAAALAVARSLSADAVPKEQAPEIHFPSSPRERLAVTSYPFRAYIESPTNRGRKPGLPGMDLTAFAGMISERFGVTNINPLGDHFRSTDISYLHALRKSVADAHSHIVDLGLSGRFFYSTDADTREAAIQFSRTWIDIATIVDSPSVRQHVRGKHGEKPDVELAVQSLGRVAEYGGKRNVVINLENDDPVSEGPFFLVSVIEKVDNPYLRALPDFGNSLIGHDGEYNQRAVAAMLKHAYNMCHVKDAVESDDGHRQTVDLDKMFELAKANSYRGYFSMECETDLSDPYIATKKLIDETLQYLT